jgi:hypothetical protein
MRCCCLSVLLSVQISRELAKRPDTWARVKKNLLKGAQSAASGTHAGCEATKSLFPALSNDQAVALADSNAASSSHHTHG